ncbi:unnamed protein product [Linum tenue]|uniref:Uncharacterized protein n=1 Tax=Linum tenue TaxID=586396 RepID=A0AAV0R6Z1_9ROSI|nr:unnamed protein product [Linum tenue]
MASAGRAMGISSFPSSPSSFMTKTRTTSSSCSIIPVPMVSKLMTVRRTTIITCCSAVQESSTSTVAEGTKKEVKPVKEEAAPAKPKPKPAAKAPVKPLPQMMEEDVIPSLKSTLEVQDDISELQLSFQDNTLEGSFVNKSIPYSFWAFFPDGILTGARGFSISSYGQGASTVEPFLIDEKKITARHVVFWVEKRLAAQGIIPVWKE